MNRLPLPATVVASRTPLLYACILGVFIATFGFRFLDPVLFNDHFEHVSMAMQIVNGHTPGVDFFDPGRPLQEYLSAAGLWLFGHQRLAEVVLCVAFLSIGSALTVWLVADVTGSIGLGVLAALLVTAIGPRLYGYPKIFVAAVALLACSRYADRTSRVRLASLAAVTTIAFFFRYDYGLYVGVTMVVALLATHWSEPRRAMAAVSALAAWVVLLCGPYLLLMASYGAFASGPGTGRLRRLLGGEDLVSLQWIAFPTGSHADAAVWLYDVFFLAPFAAAALVVRGVRTGTITHAVAAKIAAVITLALAFNLFLIRGNLDSRVPDVVVPAAILLAWMMSLGMPVWPIQSMRRFVPVAFAAVLLVTIGAAVNVYAEPGRHLVRTHLLEGPRRTHGHLLAVVRELSGPPLDAFADADARGVPALTRYLSRCTEPTDRLLVTGYRPEIYFYAHRLFGGGMVAFHANLGASATEQQMIVERLKQEQVPIAVIPVDSQRELEQVYPLVANYLTERYAVVRDSGFGDERPLFRVLVDRHRRPSAVDPEFDLPCFATGQPVAAPMPHAGAAAVS